MDAVTQDQGLRAERAEAAFWAGYARNIMTTDETRDTGAVPVAGGYAITLQGTFLTYGLGVGRSRPLRPDDLRIIDEFFSARHLASRLELHPAVAERDAALLERWGYRPERSLDVFEVDARDADAGRRLDAAEAAGITVEPVSRRSEWIDLIVEAGLDDVPVADHARLRRSTVANAAAATAVFIARLDGRVAGGGALGVVGDDALLFGAATLPALRRRGVQRALVAARMQAARARGAVCGFLKTEAARVTPERALAAGLDVVGHRIRLRKD